MTLLKSLLIALFLVGIQLSVACGGDAQPPATAPAEADETEAAIDDTSDDNAAVEETAVEE